MTSLDMPFGVLSDPLDVSAGEAKLLRASNRLSPGPPAHSVKIGPDSSHPLGGSWGPSSEWQFDPDDTLFSDSSTALAWSSEFNARWSAMQGEPRNLTVVWASLKGLRGDVKGGHTLDRPLENRDVWDCVFGRAPLPVYVSVESAYRRFAVDWFAFEKLAAVRIWCLIIAHLGWPPPQIAEIYNSFLWSEYNASDEEGTGVRPENGTSGGWCQRNLIRAKHELARAEAMMTMEEMAVVSFSRLWGEKPWEFDEDWVRLDGESGTFADGDDIDSGGWLAMSSQPALEGFTVAKGDVVLSMETPSQEYGSWFANSDSSSWMDGFSEGPSTVRPDTLRTTVTVGRKPKRSKKSKGPSSRSSPMPT
jgi:hypothetical protein